MRKNAAQLLFPEVRLAVLTTLLLHSKPRWYLSELARQVRAVPSQVHRELGLLVEAGILTRQVEGRQTYFAADPHCPFLPELTGLLEKIGGTPAVLRQALEPWQSQIACAFIHGSVARGQEQAASDVDLFIVGTVGIAELAPALRAAEQRLGRPVNPTVYPPFELEKKFRAGHHYVRTVMADRHQTFLIGTARDLAAIARGKTLEAAPDQRGRTGRTARGRGRQTARRGQ